MMTSKIESLIGYIISSKEHRDYDYKIVDASDLLNDVLVSFHCPIEHVMTMTEPVIEDETKEKEVRDIIIGTSIMAGDIIGTLGNINFIKNIEDQFHSFEEKYHVEGIGIDKYLLSPVYLCRLLTDDPKFKFIDDMQGFVDFAHIILMGHDDILNNNGKLEDMRKKYFINMPFDHFIISMNSIAYVYDKIDKSLGIIKIYSIDNGISKKLVSTRYNLDDKGGIYSIRENAIDGTKLKGNPTTEQDKHLNYILGDNFLECKLIEDISIRLINLGRIEDYLVENKYFTYDDFARTNGLIYELGREAEKVSRRFVDNRDEANVGRVLYHLASVPLNFTFGLSLLMMTCKQVRLRETKAFVPKPQKKKNNKAKGGAAKRKSISYSTISVNMEDQIIDKSGRYITEITDDVEYSGEKEYKRSRHMRRGNFAYYTKDKPLFGRITGLVWRPPMIVNAGNTNETKSKYVIDHKK